jgi:CO/xanthine dehydrogenase Mo-binding subunit
MSDQVKTTVEIEAERYELFQGPAYRFEFERREFLQLLGGIVVLLAAAPASTQESGRGGFGGPPAPKDLSAWLHIAEDGTVTLYTGKVEIGQNARTSLTQAVAEELHTPVGSIKVVMADTDLVPFDMGTFGSRTTPTMVPQVRRAARSAHDALRDLAAQQWGVDAASIVVADGKVTHPPRKRTVDFGALTKGQKLVRTVAEDTALTPTEKWTVYGKSIPKVDGRAIVTGGHRYTSDVARPGMMHGKVLRPSAMGATLTAVEDAAARAVPGAVVVRDGEFVGVAAPRLAAAERALALIQPTWKTTPQPGAAQLFDVLKKPVGGGADGGRGRPNAAGSVQEGLAGAARRLERAYTIAYIAHVPLEPRAAVAEWTDGKLTVWTGTQRPFGVKGELVEAFHLSPDKVRVIVPDTGSGYGGKHSGECAIEAARLAKAAGKPVKVAWTREEEFDWAYFRPAGVIEIKSGVDAQGKLVAWEFHNYNSGGSGIETPYEVPNRHIEFHRSDSPLRQGSYRGLAATANHFAREAHMDELASELKVDPLEFRRRHLKDARLRAVLEAAAEHFGWDKWKAEPGTGHGIACGVEKGGYVGTCASVRVDGSGAVRVQRVVAAFECGAVLNPTHLDNQVEGAVVQGLGGALFEAVEFENGRILNNRLSSYRVPRFSDLPKVEVVLINRKDLPPAGAGETPIVGVAPAIAGAIFEATGVRLRSLPMAPNGVSLPPATSPSA